MGDKCGAEELYRQAVDAHPDDANALGGLGSFLFNKEWRGCAGALEALEVLRRAVEIDPGHPSNLANLALLLSEGSESERKEAGVYFERAVEEDPSNIRNLGRLAVYQERIACKYGEAEATYCRAIQLARSASNHSLTRVPETGVPNEAGDPYLATLLANYSAFLVSYKNAPVEAGELLREAVEVDPTNAIVISMQADYYEHVLKDIAGAQMRYERACLLAPDNPDILGAFAAFLAQTRGELELAEEYYCRAIELDRRHAENLGGYAVLLMTLCRRGGDVAALIQRADDCFRIACEESAGNPPHAANYAVFLANIRCEVGEAKELFDMAIKADPLHLDTLLNYAHFLETCVEDDEAAEEVFQQALAASNHKNAQVLGSYAVFRSRVHEDSLDENRKLFERAIDADQKSSPNLAAFAQAQLKHALGL